MSESLRAPWRIDYLRTLQEEAPGQCFLCQAAAASSEAERRQRLVLWHSARSVVVINRFPYANGHLLISPLEHRAEFDELDEPTLLDLQVQTGRAIGLLRRAMNPQGFNVGMNLGRCAGAGVPGHLHQHVVPRWNGDVNFIRVVGEVGVVPQAMAQLYNELMSVYRESEGV